MKVLKLEVEHAIIKGLIDKDSDKFGKASELISKLDEEWIMKFKINNPKKKNGIEEVVIRNSVFAEHVIISITGDTSIKFEDLSDVAKGVILVAGVLDICQ